MSESPSRLLTRQEERQELGNLNGRLAVYIARVKELQDLNDSLTTTLEMTRTSEEQHLRSVRAAFEEELTLVRRGLDEESNEKARLQVELSNSLAEIDRLRALLEEESAFSKSLEEQLGDANNELESVRAELRMTQSEMKTVVRRAEKAERQLGTTEDALESERSVAEGNFVDRVSLENTIQTLKEELEFVRKTADGTEEELREQIAELNARIVAAEAGVHEKYKLELTEMLAQARERYEKEAETFRDEIKEFYERKISFVSNEDDKNTIALLRAEVSDIRLKYEQLRVENSDLTGLNGELEARVQDLDDKIDQLRASHTKSLSAKEELIARLKNAILLKDRQYKDLLDDHVALDAEIASYHRLLEGEEVRLVTGSGSTKRKRGSTSVRVEKKSRISHSILVSFDDFDTLNGTHIVLRNNNSTELDLSNWRLIAGDGVEGKHEFTFHDEKIPANGSVCLWASTAEAQAKEGDLILDGFSFFTSNTSEVTLVNESDELVAHYSFHQGELFNPNTDPLPNTTGAAGQQATCNVM